MFGGRRPGFVRVMLIEISCALQTLGLVALGRIGMPKHEVGRIVAFADGSTSRIYRETVARGQRAADPVLLAVRFQLLLRTQRVARSQLSGRRRRYPAFVLVRPDGHIAVSGELSEVAQVAGYLDRWVGSVVSPLVGPGPVPDLG